MKHQLMKFPDADRIAEFLLPAVLEAGRLEMRHFTTGVKIEQKADKSPVTAADREAEAIVVEALSRCAPNIPIIAEEAAAAGLLPPPAETFFLVDALDGTHGFIRGKPEFSVNIALIKNGHPVFGLVYGPASGRLFVTKSDGHSYAAELSPDAAEEAVRGVRWSRLTSRVPDRAQLVAFNSRSSGAVSSEFLQALDVKEARPLGSSLKFCLIASGEADLYARFGPTYEWDTAAGQAILEAAGGTVSTIDGERLSYGKSGDDYLNPHFVAWGRSPLLTKTSVIGAKWLVPSKSL